VDTKDHLVFFTTGTGFSNAADEAVDNIFVVDDHTANQTPVSLAELASVSNMDPAFISFDSANDQLWVSYENTAGTNGTGDLGHVVRYDVNVPNAGSPTGVTLTNAVDYTLGLAESAANLTAATFPEGSFLDVLPTLATTGTGSGATEQSTAVNLLSSTPTVTDPDNDHLASASVQITGGTFTSNENSTSDDHLSVGGQTSGVVETNITVSYNSTTETLTLTGYDTLADYANALANVQYNTTGDNPTNYGANTTRTLTWQVNDGAIGNPSGTNTTSTTLTVIGVNDPPTLTNVATSASYAEEGLATTLASGAAVSDPDNLNLASATVHITGTNISNGTFTPFGQATGDLLSANTAGTSISSSYDSTTETLTLSGSDTLAHYQQVLDHVTYSAGENPTDYGSDTTRLVTWVLNDGSGSSNTSAPATTTITVSNVNDPPTLSNVATSASFTEEGAAAQLSPSVSVTDPDNVTLASATVAITGGAFTGDVLSANTTGTAISASYDSSTETLKLTGTDTLADYRAVLDSVTFSAGENPTDFGSKPTRTVTWVLNDGAGSSNTSAAATTTVTVTNVNDPPTLSNVATSLSYTELAPASALSPSVTVTDPDNLNLASATVAITGGTFVGDGDALAATAAGNVTVSYDVSTETLHLTGSDTLAHYQQVLDSVTFKSTSSNPTDFGADTTRTVTWVLNDGSGSSNTSAPATTTVAITAVNNAPTLSNVAASAAFTEEGAAAQLSPSVTITDPDNLNLASATVAITGAFTGDVLSATTTGTSISASFDASTEKLKLTGSDTLAHYQQVLDSVTFAAGENPTDFGSKPTRTLTWVVDDGGGSSNTSAPVTTTVSITNVNDAPTLSGVTSSVTGGPSTTVTLSPSVTIADPDNLSLASATVVVAGGTFTGDGDVLAATTAGTSISASYNTTTETLTLSGTDTLAHYQQVLDTVTFETTAADPTNGGADPSRTISWVVNDGGSSSNLSTPQFTTVSLLSALSPGQTIFVSAGQTSSGIIVTSGSEIVVLSGGTAEDIFVLSSGVEAIDSGGTASGTVVSNGGTQYDAGTASATTVSSGGTQDVFGSAAGTTIDSGGSQQVTSGGTASGTTVSSGGTQYDAGTASGTTLSGGSQDVFGSAAGTTIDNGGSQQVISGGTASGTTVSSGGTQYDAGTASGTTLSGGTQDVFGSAIDTTIDSGGAQDVVSGGLANGTVVSSGGVQYDAGTASNTTISGGDQQVFGSADGTTISSGGIEQVISGGIASGTTVSSGGSQFVAGIASATTVAGGTVEVFSGGSIIGANISAGLLEVQSGATANGNFEFDGGGTLKLDAAESYSFLVAGFGIPDQFDLSAINFATASKQYAGNTQSGTLTVSDGTNSASILLLGNYQAGSFNLGPENGGATGTVVTDPPLINSATLAHG
jgi:autotransporter passenger strand-loop-strand repeat protein